MMWKVKVYIALLSAGSVLACGAAATQAVAVGDDCRAVVSGNNAFAFDLYAELKGMDGNLFFSPYSVSTALAMTYGGARGQTEAQMARVLHFDLPQDRLHRAFAALSGLWKGADGEGAYQLRVANALWGQQGEGFLKEFLALVKKHYGAGFREVDFARATEQARQIINAWIAEQTRHKIKELLLEGDLDPSTALVLTNAIYFKGDWASRFDRRATQDGPFWINGKEKVVVPMMHQLGRFAFAAGNELDVLELPYDGDRLSMVLLLPKQADGLAGLEESLSGENLDRWLERLRQQPVRVSLPRFSLGARFDLARTLAVMGMPDAFSAKQADFSGMTGWRGLFISAVIHQAQVEVNEEGTEAAAGTAVVMRKGPPPAACAADHPFLFLIRDKQSGSILFMGRVVNPKA